jgi:hypothetical protein
VAPFQKHALPWLLPSSSTDRSPPEGPMVCDRVWLFREPGPQRVLSDSESLSLFAADLACALFMLTSLETSALAVLLIGFLAL